jgi:hypothetical protein
LKIKALLFYFEKIGGNLQLFDWTLLQKRPKMSRIFMIEPFTEWLTVLYNHPRITRYHYI